MDKLSKRDLALIARALDAQVRENDRMREDLRRAGIVNIGVNDQLHDLGAELATLNIKIRSMRDSM